jgi:hypothetical protein
MDLNKLLTELKGALPEDSPALAHVAKLTEAITPYQGIDPNQARAALEAMKNRGDVDKQLNSIVEERDSFKSAADAYQSEALQARRELMAVRGLVKAGVRPEYEDLLLPKVSTLAQVKDGNVTIEDAVWSDLKTRYPAMFFAEDAQGTGASDSETGQTKTETSYKIDENGFLQVT